MPYKAKKAANAAAPCKALQWESKISKMKNIVSPHHKFYLGRLVDGFNIFLELLESTDNFGGQQGVDLSALHVISASYKTSLSLTSAVAIAGVGIVRLSHYKALFGFPTDFPGKSSSRQKEENTSDKTVSI